MTSPTSSLPSIKRVVVPVPWVRFAAFYLFLCILLALRKPDSLSNPQFWAEDGALFFQDQITLGTWASILHTYRGYIVLNSRLVAAFAALFPVVYAPLIYNVAALAIAGLACSIFALPWYRYLVRSDALRAATCLAAAGALYTQELVGNLTNSQSYLALIGLILLVRRTEPGEWVPLWQRVLSALFGFLAALTNPTVIIAAPICLWNLRRRRNWTVAAAVLAGMALQLVNFALLPPGVVRPPLRGLVGLDQLGTSVVIGTVYRVILDTIAGSNAVAHVSEAGTLGVLLCLLMASTAWLVWLGLRLDQRRRLQAGVAVYFAAASILLAFNLREDLAEAFGKLNHFPLSGDHYFFVAGCMLLFLIAMSIESRFTSSPEYVKAGLMMTVVAGGFIGNLAIPPFTDLQWRVYAARIEQWRNNRREHRTPVAGLIVPVNPGAWNIHLPPSAYREITITGFPDHVVALPTGDAAPITIHGGELRSLADSTYIDLPLVLTARALYRVRAVVETHANSTISLMVHGQIGGSRAETAPAAVADRDNVLETTIPTDDTAHLCIHIRHQSGEAVVRSITITLL